ncbi:lipopolysaccharide biosynthesis protein [Sphingomonas sp. KR1UV-12]|uniref:Lipopolysaccharide biosynthesis protein n=1 Tax=Sphingomonas aurea TaxID=3063994 RepID=A0ABT9EL73_9SPHN|nr:lipopolysaccharide biosynthesis protein [Sphingomonas sp. KR1UV-12]MDP1027541.1 lipopolysaccharide biosynthesis protein [Sphingomonas sp. KR1UV-12]
MMPDPLPAQASAGSTMRRAVARNLGWLLASRGVIAVLSLFYLGIATRSLGVVGFGRFALIIGAAQALAALVTFQSWQIIVQYGTGLLGDADRPALGRLFRGTAMVDLASAVVGALLAWLILEVWGEMLGIGPTLKRATLIFAIVQLLTIRSTPLGILRLRDKFSKGALADSVAPAARFVGAILVALFHPTVQGFLAVWGMAEVVTAATYWIMVARDGDLALMRDGRGARHLPREHPGIVRYALSTNASATLGLSSKQVPLLIVGAAAGPAAAGAFRLASQLAQALAKLSQMVSRAAFPEMVRTVRDVAPEALGRLLTRLFLASVAAAAAIMVLVLIAGKPVLSLVGGRDFRGAWPILLWLALAGCLDFATVAVDTVMTALQRAGTVFAIRAAGVVLMLGAAWLLIPPFGATGVAVAVAVGSAAVTVLMAAAAARLSRRR